MPTYQPTNTNIGAILIIVAGALAGVIIAARRNKNPQLDASLPPSAPTLTVTITDSLGNVIGTGSGTHPITIAVAVAP